MVPDLTPERNRASADDMIRKVVGDLRQIEKLADKGDCEGILLKARLALPLCNTPSSGEPVAAHGK
jgi:hypothetical protein